jgi:hypothetical protein
VTVARECRTTGLCGDIDVPGVCERCIGGWCDVVRIDGGHGKVGAAAVIAGTMAPVDEAVQLERIQKDHPHTRWARIRRDVAPITVAQGIGNIGTGTVSDNLQLFKGRVSGQVLAESGAELLSACC